MSYFLFELYTEEVPASLQITSKDYTLESISKLMKDEYISGFDIKVFTTPTRLTIFISNLQQEIIIKKDSKKGPKINSNEQTLEGFLKSQNTNKSDLLEKEGYYYTPENKSTIQVSFIMQKIINKYLNNLSNFWPKSMFWNALNNGKAWIRPIRNIMAIFDGQTVDGEFNKIKFNNKTFGHKFINSNKSIEISSFDDYCQKLKENNVILSEKDRGDIIKNEINNICIEKNLKCINVDVNLDIKNSIINEAIGSCEFPVVLSGKIDAKFIEMPKEIIVDTIKKHQKYFCLFDSNGNISNSFLFVCNIKLNDYSKVIYENERVCNARLNDIQFYLNEDLKQHLESKLGSLKKIIFYDKVGNLYSKTQRITLITKFISLWIANCNIIDSQRAALLSKIDLVTNGVSEIPSLQGFIGGYYAKIQGENMNVCKAISEHYKPMGASDDLPKSTGGIALAIADKIDNICSLFIVNESPTSSRDPFALRRSALGIIRILVEFNISIPLEIMISKSLQTFENKFYSKFTMNGENRKSQKARIQKEVLQFFKDRFFIWLKDKYSNEKIINSILNPNAKKYKNKFILSEIESKIKLLNDYSNKDFDTIVSMYKRVNNILSNADGFKPKKIVKMKLFSNEEKSLKKILRDIKKKNKTSSFIHKLNNLLSLKSPMNNFFDNLMINSNNKQEKNSRLQLLDDVRSEFNEVMSFNDFCI